MLAVVACAVAASLLGPATASAGLKAIWGPNELPDGRSAFPVYKDLGVDVLERQVVWARVAVARPADPRNPNDPAYAWPDDLDVAVRRAKANGIRVALLVTQSPRWATGDRDPRWVPYEPGDYANFLVALSRRYPSVRHWMIWGEVTRPGNFAPLPPDSPGGPEAYAQLLDRAYGTLKRLNRRNVVIGGMTFTAGEVSPQDWVRWMRLPNGRRPRLDWFGHNPFSRRFPDLRKRIYDPSVRDFSDLDTLSREVRRAYRRTGRRPRLWLSEFTISSDRGNRAFNFYVSRKVQARWVRTTYRIAHRHRWIAGLGWFGLLDEAGSGGLTTGLMTPAGKPKPAYYAYRRAR